MYGMPRNNHLQLITVKWLGTTLCLIGIALTSFNIYPANIVFGLLGSGLWTIAGILQRDPPLILVEAIAALLYLVGFISYIVIAISKWI
jgi:hypothetical protein